MIASLERENAATGTGKLLAAGNRAATSLSP